MQKENAVAKSLTKKKQKVRKMTQEEYDAYVMSLKEQTPPLAYEKYEREEIRGEGGKKTPPRDAP